MLIADGMYSASAAGQRMMQELLKVTVSLHHGKQALNESHVASDMLPFLMAGECAPSCAVELYGQ
jgi:hypothetical protein